MKSEKIKKLIACNIPISVCNLQCHYCYISQLDGWNSKDYEEKLDPLLIEKALSMQRLGGPCIINLTGKGETLIPEEVPDIIYRLLRQGHYLEVVTNGTLSKRFDQIASFPKELLKRLEFKFSFHYLELIEKNLMEVFWDNVKTMRNAGCSFTIELMPNDRLLPHIDEIFQLCKENAGAVCHLTIGRDDTHSRKILSNMDPEEYFRIWDRFDSKMFEFKKKVFGIKRKEFCYAGMWSLYVNLLTGDASQCYGCKTSQNIFFDISDPVYFRPVGQYCKQEYCYNAHAFMTLGVIPEISTPSYAEIRDRVCEDGSHWLTDQVKDAFSCKLENENEKVDGISRVFFYLSYPYHWIKILENHIGLFKTRKRCSEITEKNE